MTSSSMRRNSGVVVDRALAWASARACVEVVVYSSSHCATSIGEYFALGWPASKFCAHSTMVAKICGSSGLTVPKTLGLGASQEGDGASVSTIGWLVYISGQ